jgi:hypothetical protein
MKQTIYLGMHRARSFPVIKMFNEVSSLLWSPLDIRRSEERTQELLGIGFSGMLFASPDV